MECPTCGKHLRTERGVRQHHTKVHDQPLPNRTCKDCQRDFYDPKSRRVYCDDCYSESGEKNGNYRNAKETTDCKLCEETFEYYPSNKDGVYCSDCVADADEFLGTPFADIVDAERIERKCDHCGQQMTVLKSTRRQGQGRFCSNECLYSWMSAEKGDETTVYNGRWREMKRKTLERDDHTCQKCGRTKENLGQEPDVHHIKPARTFENPEHAHLLGNLIALCKRCHMLAEHGSIAIPLPKRRPSRNTY